MSASLNISDFAVSLSKQIRDKLLRSEAVQASRLLDSNSPPDEPHPLREPSSTIDVNLSCLFFSPSFGKEKKKKGYKKLNTLGKKKDLLNKLRSVFGISIMTYHSDDDAKKNESFKGLEELDKNKKESQPNWVRDEEMKYMLKQHEQTEDGNSCKKNVLSLLHSVSQNRIWDWLLWFEKWLYSIEVCSLSSKQCYFIIELSITLLYVYFEYMFQNQLSKEIVDKVQADEKCSTLDSCFVQCLQHRECLRQRHLKKKRETKQKEATEIHGKNKIKQNNCYYFHFLSQ
ncbi:hypothetical protein RFI_22233 [Reticulomyxa filosa]|uniref:Uncharacterized protein n=1 Tax=Reticulomyxa filosa TaxID=46433 RepID=X6MPV5_RETFI|nr:hypothetical protein RFI_22233 [Reticulomyxa filosa]|eukprot:ETO15130.1 hypothetical protein RFI_22233 [Reticulomyxa filosa]